VRGLRQVVFAAVPHWYSSAPPVLLGSVTAMQPAFDLP
jgi:hypothetical protein